MLVKGKLIMTILGIDPGTRYAGFAIIEKKQVVTRVLNYGCLVMQPQKPLQTRIAMFHDFLIEILSSEIIDIVALETPFLGKNAQNFLKLGYIRGIIYLLADKHNIKMSEFSPREIKQAITGFGGASKQQVARVIMQLFPRIRPPQKDDVTDALSIALCSLWRNQQTLVQRR